MVANSVPFSPLAATQAKLALLGLPGALFCRIIHSVRSLKGSDVIWVDELFREEHSRGTVAGNAWAKTLAAGGSTPSELMLGVLRHRFWTRRSNRGFLLAGAPTDIGQAATLESWLDERDETLTAVVAVRQSREEALVEAERRRVCPNDGTIHFVEEGDACCSVCGGRLQDDRERGVQAVRHWYDAYAPGVSRVAAHFRREGLLLELDGSDSLDRSLTVLDDAISSLIADR